MNKLLLDTHAWFWLVAGDKRMAPSTVALLEEAQHESNVYLSQISMWEIAHKIAAGKIQVNRPVAIWMQENTEGLQLTDLPLDIVVESMQLPGAFHKDPADRFIVATARTRGLRLVTGDELILAYAKAGHVNVVPVQGSM